MRYGIARYGWALGASLGVHVALAAVMAWTARPVAWSWDTGDAAAVQEVALWVERGAPAAAPAEPTEEPVGAVSPESVKSTPAAEEAALPATAAPVSEVPPPAADTVVEPPPETPEPAPAPPEPAPPSPPSQPEPAQGAKPAPPPKRESAALRAQAARSSAAPAKRAETAIPKLPKAPAARASASTRASPNPAGGAARTAGAGAAAGAGKGQGRGKGGEGAVAARPWRTPRPPYPPEAKARGWQGLVSLRVKVGPNGAPLAVEVIKSSGYALLDEQARRTVATQWKFHPAEVGGVPTTSTVIVPVRFALR